VRASYCADFVAYSKGRRWSGCGNIATWMVGRLKTNAKRKHVNFSSCLGCSALWELYKRQGGRCALTGLEIIFPPHSYKRSQGTASLDRTDSSKGYVPDNVQWVHKDVNNVKGSLSLKRLLFLCKKITQKRRLLMNQAKGA